MSTRGGHRLSGDVPIRSDGLQLEEHVRLQVRHWRIEKVAWGVFALILAAAIAGIFSSGGPLSRQASVIGTAEIDAPRFSRWQTSDRLLIRFVSGDDTQIVAFGSGFLDAYAVESISPEPLKEVSVSGQLQIEVAAGTEGLVVISLTPLRAGIVSYSLAVEGGEKRIGSFVWP